MTEWSYFLLAVCVCGRAWPRERSGLGQGRSLAALPEASWSQSRLRRQCKSPHQATELSGGARLCGDEAYKIEGAVFKEQSSSEVKGLGEAQVRALRLQLHGRPAFDQGNRAFKRSNKLVDGDGKTDQQDSQERQWWQRTVRESQ